MQKFLTSFDFEMRPYKKTQICIPILQTLSDFEFAENITEKNCLMPKTLTTNRNAAFFHF
jgi:hypothetical protein